MIIRQVRLVNFRNHDVFVLDCKKEKTVITGKNGCGKTSILEAIYEALQGKSFRAVDQEIVHRDAEFYRVEVEYEDGRKVVVVFCDGKKEFLVEDKKVKRLPKKNKYPIILFEPDDLHLIGSSPASRRNYFDRMFSQLSDEYSKAASCYNKALKQRNELLKQDGVRVEDLLCWDILLARYGVELVEKRLGFVEKINKRFTEVYGSIAKNNDVVNIIYSGGENTENDYFRKLSQDFDRDVLLGYTSYGVHHDVYEFMFNGAKADGSASRGEIRSLVLALKFIEAEMVFQILGKRPVILLDDVFSELDQVRQKCLVKNFQENQVILTSVGDKLAIQVD